MQSIDNRLSRHRVATLVVGLTLGIAIVGLSAHRLLPEHHADTQDVVCVASLVIAIAAACAWHPRLRPRPIRLTLAVDRELAPAPEPYESPSAALARAGPAGSVVRRR